MPHTKHLISVVDAAKEFACSEAYLRQLAGKGRVKRHRVHDRYYLLDKRSVEKFFSQPRKIGRPRK